MEIEENNIPEEQDGEAVEIYSKRAIFWFSVLASPLFGGILLALNLKAAGYKKAVYIVSIFTLLYYFLVETLMDLYINFYKMDMMAYQKKLMAYKAGPGVLDMKISLYFLIGLAFDVIGGLIFTQYFFRKYFPENDYYPKSIVAPLFVTIAVILLLGLAGVGRL